MRVMYFEINQYIDFGLQYFLGSNWSKAQFQWLKNIKDFLEFLKKST